MVFLQKQNKSAEVVNAPGRRYMYRHLVLGIARGALWCRCVDGFFRYRSRGLANARYGSEWPRRAGIDRRRGGFATLADRYEHVSCTDGATGTGTLCFRRSHRFLGLPKSEGEWWVLEIVQSCPGVQPDPTDPSQRSWSEAGQRQWLGQGRAARYLAWPAQGFWTLASGGCRATLA